MFTAREKGLIHSEFGSDRGKKMADFLETVFGPLNQSVVLDVGCGLGGISMEIAKRCRHLIALDYDFDRRLAVLKKRMVGQESIPLSIVHGDSHHLPLRDESLDVILLNGVLEWLGESRRDAKVREVQLQVLRSLLGLLRPNGILYIATENRYYPIYALKDPHARVPLVSVLPRRLADLVSYLLRRTPYRAHMHSYWGLRLLGKEVGGDPSIYVPIPNYYYPVRFADIEQGASVREGFISYGSETAASEDYLRKARGSLFSLKSAFYRFMLLIGAAKLFSPAFVMICRKRPF